MWLEPLRQTEDEKGWNERDERLCGCEFMGVEDAWVPSATDSGEASVKHQAGGAKRRAEREPCLQEAGRAASWVHVLGSGRCGVGCGLSLSVGLHSTEIITLAPEKGIDFFCIPWTSRQSGVSRMVVGTSRSGV